MGEGGVVGRVGRTCGEEKRGGLVHRYITFIELINGFYHYYFNSSYLFCYQLTSLCLQYLLHKK
jgi:hypothetical protein